MKPTEPNPPNDAELGSGAVAVKIHQVPPLDGVRVAFVGKLGSMNRKEARELVRKHGGSMVEKIDASVDLVVIGADQLSFDQHDELLDDWVLDAASNNQIDIISETTLWQQLGMVESEQDVGQLYTPAMLARLLGLPIATIRRWHRCGLISPTRQVHKLAYFDFEEVASARRLAKLIASGAAPKQIEARLSRVADLFPELHRPLSQLSVIVEGQHVLLRQGEGLLEPGGQLRIDFDSLDNDGVDFAGGSPSVLSIDGLADPGDNEQDLQTSLERLATPAEFIELAMDLEDDGETQMAIEVYRSAALAFGPTADVCFRIAELLYQAGDLAAARERYYVAVELDETFVEARANLGCVLMESGQAQLSIAAFEGALQHHPDYPDVHFYLARVLDDVERGDEATVHWQQFLDLAPKSPWADEARSRLES